MLSSSRAGSAPVTRPSRMSAHSSSSRSGTTTWRGSREPAAAPGSSGVYSRKLTSETSRMRALWRGRRRSRRRAAYSPPKPPPAITTSYATAAEASAPQLRGAVPPGAPRRARDACAPAGAGAPARGRPRRRGWPPWRSPPRPRAARAAGARRGPTAAARPRSRATQKQCTQRPPGVTSRAPASPTSQTPSSPCSSARPVRRWSSRSSWPSRSPSSPCATASARSWRGPFGRATVAPRAAYSSGMIQACAAATKATGAVIGSSQSIPAAAARNGIV